MALSDREILHVYKSVFIVFNNFFKALDIICLNEVPTLACNIRKVYVRLFM